MLQAVVNKRVGFSSNRELTSPTFSRTTAYPLLFDSPQ